MLRDRAAGDARGGAPGWMYRRRLHRDPRRARAPQRSHFAFIARERTAGPPLVREAIATRSSCASASWPPTSPGCPARPLVDRGPARAVGLIVTAMVAFAENTSTPWVARAPRSSSSRTPHPAADGAGGASTGPPGPEGPAAAAARGSGRGRGSGSGLEHQLGRQRGSCGRSSTPTPASATVTGSIQARGVVVLALLGVHLLLHRGGGASREQRGDPHTVLRPPRRAARRRGPSGRAWRRRRPTMRVGEQPGTELTSTTVQRASRSAGSARRVRTRRGTVDRQLLGPCRGRQVGDAPSSTTPAACTTESSRAGRRPSAARGWSVGEVGHQHVAPGCSTPSSSALASERATSTRSSHARAGAGPARRRCPPRRP